MDLLQYKDKLQFSTRDGVKFIYDPNNKMWRKVQPEELVRQCFYQYLLEVKSFPHHLMKIEYNFFFINEVFRADLIVMDKHSRIKVIAECKSFHLILQQKHVDQVAFYNQKIQAPFLILTNGVTSKVYHKDQLNEVLSLEDLPPYDVLLQ